jgi:hypothetical protein
MKTRALNESELLRQELEQANSGKKKLRKCIGNRCGGKMFLSWGPGNRLCPKCRVYAVNSELKF